MSSSAPRRRAARPPSRRSRAGARLADVRQGPVPLAIGLLVVAAGLAALATASLELGPTRLRPDYLSQAGSVAIAVAFTWALAARTGGRPLVFGALALAIGVAVILMDRPTLTTGAAVATATVSAVLGIMATVPAVRVVQAVREVLIGVVIAAVGALATVGFEPSISLLRFEYTTLALALMSALGLVYRLGAGLHGLGRRGILTVLVGSVLLAVTLAYAELLRRYGTPVLVEWLFDGVRWSRDNLGAFPRPLEAALGVPALAWGVHMRARRRQGWWVCAFGVAATSSVATSLLNTSVTRVEAGLAVLYAVVVGLVIGTILIWLDLRLTGTRGRRGARSEQAAAVRPEPSRTSALL